MTSSLEDLQKQIRTLQDSLAELQAEETKDNLDAASSTDDASNTDASDTPSAGASKSARRRARRRRAAEEAARATQGDDAADEQAPGQTVDETPVVATPAADESAEETVSPKAVSTKKAAATKTGETKAKQKAAPAVETDSDDTDTDSDDSVTESDTEVAEPRRIVARAGRIATKVLPASRRGRIVAGAVAAVVVAGGVTAAVVLPGDDSLPSNVAFRLAGKDITVDQLDAEAKTLKALYGIQPPTKASELASFRRDTAKAYAVSLIISDAATSRGIVIADKSASDVLAKYVAQQFGSATDAYDNFVQALGAVGTTAGAVTTEIKRQLALSQLFDKVTAGVTVSDSELTAAFAKDKASLATPEKRTLSNIVVSSEAQAKTALAAIRSGTPFATEASKVSLDTSTSKSGGSLGSVAAGQLDDGYAKAAFAASKGGLFGPVKTQYGWNVGEVTAITPSTPAVYSKVKATLKEQVETQKELSVWRTWLGKVIKGAHVQYNPTYKPTNPDAAPSGTPASIDSPTGK